MSTVLYDTKTGAKLSAGQTTVVNGKTVTQGSSYEAAVSSPAPSSGGGGSSGGSSSPTPAPTPAPAPTIIKYDPNTGATLSPGQIVLDKNTGKYVQEGTTFGTYVNAPVSPTLTTTNPAPNTTQPQTSPSSVAPTPAPYNPNTGQPLLVGQTATKDGITYTGTATAPATTTPSTTDQVNKFNPNTGSPLQPGETVLNNETGQYVTEGQVGSTKDAPLKKETVLPTDTNINNNITPSSQILQQGSKGQDVSNLQTILGITSDGEFGPETLAAVKAFQASNGLKVDGIVGPLTLVALQKANSGPTGADNVNMGITDNLPADDPSKQYNSDTGELNPNYKPEIPSTGNPEIDALIKVLNNQSPQKSFTDVYQEVYDSLGISTIKQDYEDQTKAYTDLLDKKNDEVQDINNNPWYSNGVRVKKLQELDNKYEGKETILTNKLKLLEADISSARSEAQFIAGKVMTQLDQSAKLTEDIINKAIDIAEKKAEASAKLTKTSSTTSTKGNVTSGSLTFSASQLSQVSQELEKSKTLYGGDGKYVNPEVYQQAYDAWVSAGGLAKDFLAKFPPKTYVNPANTTLPDYLRSSTTKAKTTNTNDIEP